MTVLLILIALFIATSLLAFLALSNHKADEREVVSSFVRQSWKAANRILLGILAVSLFLSGFTPNFIETLLKLFG